MADLPCNEEGKEVPQEMSAIVVQLSSDHDVILNADNTRFMCDKEVLTKHSGYFQALFRSQMKENLSNEVNFTDIDAESLHNLLCYFYTGELYLDPQNTFHMTHISDRFQAPGAVEECCKQILETIHENSCLKYVCLSKSLMLREVYDQCLKYALWHFYSVCQTESFGRVSSIEVITEYLQHPYLNTNSEVDVFRAAARWYSLQDEYKTQGLEEIDLVVFFGSVVNFHLMKEDISVLKDLEEVKNNKTLEEFVASFKLEDVTIHGYKKGLPRVRSSPQNGRILCVGAHQCSQSCQKECEYITDRRALDEVLEFNPDTCSLQPFSSFSEHYPNLTPYSRLTVCAVGHLLYIVGGGSETHRVGDWLYDIWCLNTLNGKWHEAGSLPQPRRHHGVCTYGSRLILVGGTGFYRIPLKSVDTFETEEEAWDDDIPDMLFSENLPAVSSHEDSLFVVKNYFQMFRFSTSTWTYEDLSSFYSRAGFSDSALLSPMTYDALLRYKLDLNRNSASKLGWVIFKNCLYSFEWHTGESVAVKRFIPADGSLIQVGVMENTVLTSNFVTVPGFPHFSPSDSNHH